MEKEDKGGFVIRSVVFRQKDLSGFGEQIRAASGKENQLLPREDKIRETIVCSKNAYYHSQEDQHSSYFEFLFTQSKFIKKGWWLGQFLLLLGLWALMYLENSEYIKRMAGVMIPLFVIMMVPELWKNRRNQSTEIENAAYFTLRQIYSARLTIFAMVDLVLLSIFMTAVSLMIQLSIWEMLICLVIPFNVTCCICFTILFSRQFSSEYLAVTLSLVWSFLWSRIILCDSIYMAVSWEVWIMLLLFSASYLVFAVWKVLKNSEKDCEVNISWS